MSKRNRERREQRRTGSEPGVVHRITITELMIDGVRKVKISSFPNKSIREVRKLIADALSAAEHRELAEREKAAA